MNSTNMPTSNLAEKILCNRKQAVAPGSHMLPLIWREKERPKLNPVNIQPDNLEEIDTTCLVEHQIIHTSPNRPAQGWNANTNYSLNFLINSI